VPRQEAMLLDRGTQTRLADGNCTGVSGPLRLLRQRDWANEKGRRGYRRPFSTCRLDMAVVRDAEAFRGGDTINPKILALTGAIRVVALAIHKAANTQRQGSPCL